MFKKIIVYSTCLSIIGCQAIENPLANVSSNAISSSGCAEKPTVSLSGKDVETVALNESTINKSGQVSANKNIGYTFTATTGQKLSYSTDADICIWVFTPDNEILKGGELSKNGKYVIQVAAPQGAKTFDLKMSLGIVKAAVVSTPSATPINDYKNSASSSQNNINQSQTNTNLPDNDNSTSQTSVDIDQNDSNSSSTSTNINYADINRDEALDLVQKWYAAKPRIFGPPYDTALVNQLATGKLYTFTTKADGPVAWLEKNDAYYKYNISEVKQVINFSNSGRRPYITVRVFEEMYLYGKNGIDRENSGSSTNNFIYVFEKENGIWKSSDYKKVGR